MRLLGTLAAATAALALAAVPAHAAPDCTDATQARVLLTDQGKLESVIVDRAGRLFFTDLDGNRLLRLDAPGAQPRVLASIPAPGGLAIDATGHLIVGTGNSAQNGLQGDVTGPAGLLRVHPDTGTVTPFATGLAMANGVVRGPDGTYYATNDFGSSVDRIASTGGAAQRNWSRVDSGNGIAVDSSGRWLYVAQTFRPAAVQRIEIASPQNVTTYAAAEPADSAAGLDGMTIDARDRLLVAANGSGELWRVTNGNICVVARGLPKFPDGPSAVAVGVRDTPFPPSSAYVVTFDGQLLEVPNVAASKPAAKPKPKQRKRKAKKRRRAARRPARRAR